MIVLLATILRVYGVHWGLPNNFHFNHSYHGDEIFLLTWADWLKTGQQIIPKHFIYGGTFYYISLQMTICLGQIAFDLFGGNKIFLTILIGRYFCILYAAATIYTTFMLAKILFSKKVALLSALMLAVVPAHIFWAQRVRPDMIFTLFFTLNCLIAARIFKGIGSLKFNIILSGIILGISIATRFPAAVIFLGYAAALFFHFRALHSVKETVLITVKFLCAIFIVCCLTYPLASPHTFIYFKQFIAGMVTQWTYQSRVYADAIGRGPGWYQYGVRILSQTFGYPFYFIVILGVCYSVWQKKREDYFMACFILPYFLLLSATSFFVVRYTLPLTPLLVVLAARFLVNIGESYARLKLPVTVFFLATLTWTIVTDLAYSKVLVQLDSRDAAAIWVNKNTQPDDSIGTFISYASNVFDNPPIPNRRNLTAFNLKRADIDTYLNTPFDYIILCEKYLKDARRLGKLHPEKSYHRLYLWSEKHTGYDLVKVFYNKPELFGVNFEGQFSSVDYALALPKIYIFKRQDNIE